jgi:phosphate-selective porin OprO/OprP
MVNRLSTQMQQQPGATTGGPAGPDVNSPSRSILPSRAGGYGAPGQSLPPNPAPSDRFQIPAMLEDKKGNVKFGPGFEIRSDDDEFIFQFHNLTQFEYRGYQQYGQTNVKDSFLIPRQWFMFSGRITQPVGYFVSLAEGFDTTNILDVFLDLNFDRRFTIRAGRFKTPFTYEFMVEPIQGLILPERSIFFNNFGENRDLGVMAYGRLFNNTLDYATGIFNGNRNGFVANADSKFITSYIDWKPFNNAEGSILENLNVGGSVFGGNQTSLPVPAILRTVVPTAGNSVAGVPFLAFNNNVRQSGMLTFWDLHTAWYYRQLAIIGEWASGFQDYALANNLAYRTHLPIDGFYITASYMLTGETRSSVGIVKPLRPFNMRRSQFGFGAWELVARYSQLDLGSQVFTAGLADPNLWANRVNVTDAGFNWHINQYLKFMFDWEHSEFNQPVLYAPNKRQLNADLFLARIQLFF